MMHYNGILDQKLFALQERLAELRTWPIGSAGDFKNNSILRNAVERSLQVCIEIMIDISEIRSFVGKRNESLPS